MTRPPRGRRGAPPQTSKAGRNIRKPFRWASDERRIVHDDHWQAFKAPGEVAMIRCPQRETEFERESIPHRQGPSDLVRRPDGDHGHKPVQQGSAPPRQQQRYPGVLDDPRVSPLEPGMDQRPCFRDQFGKLRHGWRRIRRRCVPAPAQSPKESIVKRDDVRAFRKSERVVGKRHLRCRRIPEPQPCLLQRPSSR